MLSRTPTGSMWRTLRFIAKARDIVVFMPEEPLGNAVQDLGGRTKIAGAIRAAGGHTLNRAAPFVSA